MMAGLGSAVLLAPVDRSLLWLPKVEEETTKERESSSKAQNRLVKHFVLHQTCEHSKRAYKAAAIFGAA